MRGTRHSAASSKERGREEGCNEGEPSSGMWGRSEDQQGRKRSQKEWNQPSEEALRGRGWGAEANAEKWTRHKWTTRRSYGMSAPSTSQSEQSKTAAFKDGEKPIARE